MQTQVVILLRGVVIASAACDLVEEEATLRAIAETVCAAAIRDVRSSIASLQLRQGLSAHMS